jgi:Nucleotidyl transferase AbiEii toxin, Type IV TA system
MTLARAAGDDANVILSRYATERLLYRLAQSPHANQFVLKGAVMFLVWTKNMYRPTMDLDLLGFGEDSAERLEQVFRDCCDLRSEPDGFPTGNMRWAKGGPWLAS